MPYSTPIYIHHGVFLISQLRYELQPRELVIIESLLSILSSNVYFFRPNKLSLLAKINELFSITVESSCLQVEHVILCANLFDSFLLFVLNLTLDTVSSLYL